VGSVGGGGVHGECVCVCYFADVAGFHRYTLHRLAKLPFLWVNTTVLKKEGRTTTPQKPRRPQLFVLRRNGNRRGLISAAFGTLHDGQSTANARLNGRR